MNIHDLHKKMTVVLDEEKRAYAAKGRRSGDLGSMNIGTQSEPNLGWTKVGQIKELLFEESNSDVIKSPNATLLIKLYSTLDKEGKGAFVAYLIGNLRRQGNYTEIGYFIFFVLYRIGEIESALQAARRNLSGDTQHGYSNVLCALSMVVSREYLEIDTRTYETIKLILTGDTEHDFNLKEKINLALLKHLEAELSDVNPEVNADRDKIVELWGKKFSSPEVPSTIKEIEDYFHEGDFSATKFATCIGRIRVLLVEVSKKIGAGLSQDGAGLKSSADDAAVFQYLRDKKFISDAEWNILRSLYALASDDGAHSIISNREYARLIKNMSYEIILLFLSKSEL